MSQPAATQDLREDAAPAPNAEPNPAAPEAEQDPGAAQVSPSRSSEGSKPAAAHTEPRTSVAREWGLRLLGVLIAAHILAILTWSVPGDAPAVKRIRHFFEPYLLYTGLWQSWDMFSPNPMSINAYLEAELTMANGTKKVWEFPRMEKMGLFDKFRYERYRKWAIDRVRLDAYSGIWPETARYIARLFYDDPAGPPREITLVRHWRTIKDPRQLWIPLGKENELLKEDSYAFFHYNVRPEDIQPPPEGAR